MIAQESYAEMLLSPLPRILLVDDNTPFLRVMQRYFELTGHMVLSLPNASGALELVKSQKIDIIISDYEMPGMSGDALLEKVKSAYPDTLGYLMTGNPHAAENLGKLKEPKGIKSVFIKPFSFIKLRDVILYDYYKIKEAEN